jgi:hypothetical protein
VQASQMMPFIGLDCLQQFGQSASANTLYAAWREKETVVPTQELSSSLVHPLLHTTRQLAPATPRKRKAEAERLAEGEQGGGVRRWPRRRRRAGSSRPFRPALGGKGRGKEQRRRAKWRRGRGRGGAGHTHRAGELDSGHAELKSEKERPAQPRSASSGRARRRRRQPTARTVAWSGRCRLLHLAVVSMAPSPPPRGSAPALRAGGGGWRRRPVVLWAATMEELQRAVACRPLPGALVGIRRQERRRRRAATKWWRRRQQPKGGGG